MPKAKLNFKKKIPKKFSLKKCKVMTINRFTHIQEITKCERDAREYKTQKIYSNV